MQFMFIQLSLKRNFLFNKQKIKRINFWMEQNEKWNEPKFKKKVVDLGT